MFKGLNIIVENSVVSAGEFLSSYQSEINEAIKKYGIQHHNEIKSDADWSFEKAVVSKNGFLGLFYTTVFTKEPIIVWYVNGRRDNEIKVGTYKEFIKEKR